MSLTVTVVDNETGDTDSAQVADGDYIVIVADPCRIEGVTSHDGGERHVIYIEDRVVQ